MIKIYYIGLSPTKVVNHLIKNNYENISYSFKENCYLATRK